MDISDIARLAGVSPSTVSKVINHKDSSISEQTRERVQKVVREFHYVPHAKSRVNRTWLLGVCFRSPISLDSTLDGILSTAQARGYSTLVFNSYADQEQERKNLMALKNSGAIGILWEPVSPESLELLTEIQSSDTHVVTMGANGGNRAFLLPYEDASYAITSKLLDQGHERIACLAAGGRRTPDFIHGFRRCLFDRGITFTDDLVFSDPSDALLDKIGRGEITGIVSSHYYMARALYARLNTIRYHAPDDYSLVSLRNDAGSSWADDTDRAISTCTVRNSDFGKLVCENLLQLVEDSEEAPRFSNDFSLDNTNSLGKPPCSRAKRVIVVGSINIDTRLSVESLPTYGTTTSSSRALSYLGGKGVNQSIGITKLGHQVSLIGCVGSDSSSDSVYQQLEDWGVDTAGIIRKHGKETGRAFIFGRPDGETLITVLSGANANLHAGDISAHETIFDGASFCIAQSEVPMDAIGEAFRLAHAHGAPTLLKPSACLEIPNDVLGNVDILVPNEKELEAIAPEGDTLQERVQALAGLGISTIIVTLGEAGCCLYKGGEFREFATPRNKAVDTTGAGDAFISALVSCLLDSEPLERAIEKASCAASYSVAHFGVADSLIEKHALDCIFGSDCDSDQPAHAS